jgi:hypothetical protein
METFIDPFIRLTATSVLPPQNATFLGPNDNNLLILFLYFHHLIDTDKNYRNLFIRRLDEIGFYGTPVATEKEKIDRFPFFDIFLKIASVIDPNHTNDNGENALMVSAGICKLNYFLELIDTSDIYHRDDNGNSVLPRISNCSDRGPNSKDGFSKSPRYLMLQSVYDHVLLHKDKLIAKENKKFLMEMINVLVAERLTEQLIKLISEIENTVGYSLNVNVKNLIANHQNTIPKVLSKDSPKYPRSGRPVTQMSKLINKSALRRITIDPKNIFDNFIVEPECFCLDANIGNYTDKFIPVLRYGKSTSEGFYGTQSGQFYNDPDFTWYYIEPDSDIYLYCDRVVVFRNKLQAVLILSKLYEDKTGDDSIPHSIEARMLDLIEGYLLNIRDETAYDEDWTEEFEPAYHQLKSDDHFLNKFRINIFLENTEVPILGTRFTNFFRTLDSPNEIYFGGGLLDFLDETIQILASQLDINVVVLTHQAGNSGRLVSELVDIRKRSVSFSNLFLRN